jgi:uncharacterized membrane protein YiaA
MQNQKKILNTVGTLALIASVAMYGVGSTNSHLTELVDFFWSPLILAVVCFVAAQKSEAQK